MSNLTHNERLLSELLFAYQTGDRGNLYPWCGVTLYDATPASFRHIVGYHAELETTVYVIFATAGQLASAGLWARAQAADGDIVLSVVIEE